MTDTNKGESMSKSNYFFGELLTSKSGTKYIKINKDITLNLKEGDCIFMEKPEQNLARLVEKGFITQEEAKERTAKIPDFLHYLLKTPQA